MAQIVRGARMLRAFLDAAGSMKQRDLCGLLGVSEQAMWTWKAGTRRPGAEHREALEQIAKIPRDAWLKPHERKALDRIRAA